MGNSTLKKSLYIKLKSENLVHQGFLPDTQYPTTELYSHIPSFKDFNLLFSAFFVNWFDFPPEKLWMPSAISWTLLQSHQRGLKKKPMPIPSQVRRPAPTLLLMPFMLFPSSCCSFFPLLIYLQVPGLTSCRAVGISCIHYSLGYSSTHPFVPSTPPELRVAYFQWNKFLYISSTPHFPELHKIK